ncbi:MAG: hypothetical protein FJ151_04330, partial [Euryarchaeota archaeon]|nr:hypothetical protein [Euryarchaeota archaeon]
SPDPDLDVIVATILTASVALGISTGVSVYEAESIEQERRIEEMERALLISLEDTDVMKTSKTSLLLISLTNLSAPIISCAVILIPFLLFPDGEIRTTAYIAVGLAISMLFVTGAVMGRLGGRNPWLKGARMAVIGFFAFVLCFWIESLV